jgi:hypothetical protein
VILRRRTVLKWGFRLGVVAAYLTDSQHGQRRREDILDGARQFTGNTPLRPVVDWLAAVNESELALPAAMFEATQRGLLGEDEEYDEHLEDDDEFADEEFEDEEEFEDDEVLEDDAEDEEFDDELEDDEVLEDDAEDEVLEDDEEELDDEEAVARSA